MKYLCTAFLMSFLSACSSIPEPPYPSGERIAINMQFEKTAAQTKQTQEPAQPIVVSVFEEVK